MNSEPGLVGSLLMGIAIVLLFNAGIILSIIRNYQLFDRIEQHNERITSFKKIRTGVSFSFVFLLVVGALLSVIAASKLKMIVMENSILVFLIISVILTIFPIFIADVLEKVYKKMVHNFFFTFWDIQL